MLTAKQTLYTQGEPKYSAKKAYATGQNLGKLLILRGSSGRQSAMQEQVKKRVGTGFACIREGSMSICQCQRTHLFQQP